MPLLTRRANPLIETRGTDFDIQAYIDWLDRGAEAFRNK